MNISRDLHLNFSLISTVAQFVELGVKFLFLKNEEYFLIFIRKLSDFCGDEAGEDREEDQQGDRAVHGAEYGSLL